MKFVKMTEVAKIVRNLVPDALSRDSCTYVLCRHGNDGNGNPIIAGVQVKRKKVFSAEQRQEAIEINWGRILGKIKCYHRDERLKYAAGGVYAAGDGDDGGLNAGYLLTHAKWVDAGVFAEIDVLARLQFPLTADNLPWGMANWRVKYID